MIIGLQIGATSGCAVYDNGKILYAVSEERFTRRKNESNYPTNAIEQAKEFCHITSDKIEKVVLVSENMTPIHFLCDLASYGIDDYVKEEKLYYYQVLINNEEQNYLEVFSDKCKKTNYKDLYNRIICTPKSEWSRIWNEWRIEKVSNDFGISKDKICIMNHEYSHAAYGFYGSQGIKAEEMLAVVYDGFGDYSNASIYVSKDGRLKQIKKYNNFNIGRVYRYITLLLGMKPGEHEYKVMGLAPYANEYIYKKPLEIFKNAYQFVEGEVIVNPEVKDNYYYFRERLEGCRFDGIAGAVQIFTEEMNKKLVSYWMKKENKDTCVLSGGVSLNIKANMEIGKLDCVKRLFVVGSGSDESLCIGAIYSYLDSTNRSVEIKPLQNLYLGDDISDIESRELIDDVESSYSDKYEVKKRCSAEYIAKLLSEGLVLGRVSGRMEFGARALGNRSILADPRNADIVTKINKKIKNRDFWMPFAPSILAEDEELYLDNKKGFDFPYMAIGCETTQLGSKVLRAALHPSDKTARPQLVTEDMNKEYYQLLKEFKKITGVGALLNTSLNLHGYPIVRTVKEAFKVLEHSDLDGLIVGDDLIIRK